MLPISPFKFNFLISLFLISVRSIKTEENITQISKNDTEKKLFPITSVKTMKSVSDIIKAKSKDPAPIYENLDIHQIHKNYNSENGTISKSIEDVDQRSLNNNKRESNDFKPSTFLGKIGEINFTGKIVNPFLKEQNVGSVNSVLDINNESHHNHNQQSVSENNVKFFDTDHGYKTDSMMKVQPIRHDSHNNLETNHSNDHYHFSINNHQSQKSPGQVTKVIQGVISIKPANLENSILETTENPYQHNVNNNHDHNQYKQQYYPPGENQFHHYHHQANIQKPQFIENTERPVIFENNKFKFPNGEQSAHHYNNYDHVGHVNSLEHLQRPEFEFDQFRKPETYVDHFRKPDLFGDHLKKPDLFGDHFNKKPEIFFDYLKKPESSIDDHQTGFHGNWNHFAKPENVYVITHEVAHMKTKHFPHSIQHLPIVPEIPAALELPLHDCNLKKNRASLWKKIFHILGTAIPIGLLIAAFTPKVINIEPNNSTEPNIILQKMKSDNLPIEHRAGRISVNRDTCEEKTICETILEGAKGQSNLVQSTLWNLSKRITDEIAKKNGLQEIFAAAKRKDCGSLTC